MRGCSTGPRPENKSGVAVSAALDPVRGLPQPTWMWPGCGNWKLSVPTGGREGEGGRAKHFEPLSVVAGQLVFSFVGRRRGQHRAAGRPRTPAEVAGGGRRRRWGEKAPLLPLKT